jgi:hypothetical protein
MPSILSQKQDMAAYYGTKAVYAFMATGDPGTGTTVANEAAGGSPAYVRLPIPWGAPHRSVRLHADLHLSVHGRLSRSAPGCTVILRRIRRMGDR